MSKIQERIKVDMDALQAMMESDAHLSDLEGVVNKLSSVSLYRTHMNDEDKDYFDAIHWFLEERGESSWQE
jgi:hypothetical protein|tara:strand:+ start:422 stop:634 length:213 start_codon:yes stop_codon:yes gene_type:complete